MSTIHPDGRNFRHGKKFGDFAQPCDVLVLCAVLHDHSEPANGADLGDRWVLLKRIDCQASMLESELPSIFTRCLVDCWLPREGGLH